MNRRQLLMSFSMVTGAMLLGVAPRRVAAQAICPKDFPFTRRRPPLGSLSAAVQGQLAAAIIDYAHANNFAVADRHKLHNGAHGFGVWGADPSIVGFGVPSGHGRDFFYWHRDYLAGLERALKARNMILPSWAPWEPIPSPFMQGIQRRPPIRQEVFAIYSDDVIGHWENEDVMGVTLSWGPHFAVHALSGGNMANVDRAARTPIFWPWHAFIDELHLTWKERRDKYGSNQPTPPYYPWCGTNAGGAAGGPGMPGGGRVQVPFCMGRTLGEARQRLNGAGLQVGQTDSNDNSKRVISQEPMPWGWFAPGTPVKLTTQVATAVQETVASVFPPRPPF